MLPRLSSMLWYWVLVPLKDVKSFTKLAMSGMEEDTQTDELMQTLFSKGVVDIDDTDILAELSQNDDLINDVMG